MALRLLVFRKAFSCFFPLSKTHFSECVFSCGNVNKKTAIMTKHRIFNMWVGQPCSFCLCFSNLYLIPHFTKRSLIRSRFCFREHLSRKFVCSRLVCTLQHQIFFGHRIKSLAKNCWWVNLFNILQICRMVIVVLLFFVYRFIFRYLWPASTF